ncbi:hypothetical protein [Segetibacter aerophilus]|uniref:hypothetical protein n=1 Tax=Segetibacter aerophilus TaxID=670293 RepID=UPI00147908F4|nr:hypothetical protein [Segetibacter aerophilus]
MIVVIALFGWLILSFVVGILLGMCIVENAHEDMKQEATDFYKSEESELLF